MNEFGPEMTPQSPPQSDDDETKINALTRHNLIIKFYFNFLVFLRKIIDKVKLKNYVLQD